MNTLTGYGYDSSKQEKMQLLHKKKFDYTDSEDDKKILLSVRHTQTWDIEQLDYAKPLSDDLTLRQMIMDIKSKKFPTIPLFHCVDLNWQGDGYVFQFCPNVQEEAEVMIQTLLPYLTFLYPSTPVLEYFTLEFASRCESLYWDPNSKEIKDTTFDDDEDADDDVLIGFSLDINEMDTQVEADERPVKDTTAPSPYDDDSVPTLNPKSAPPSNRFTPITSPASKRSLNSTTPTAHLSQTTCYSTSVWSGTSTITMETIHGINQRLDALANKVESTDSQFGEIMSLLSTTLRQTAPTEKISSSTGEGNTGAKYGTGDGLA